MDAKQFLKEAREQYSEKEFPPPKGFYKFWEDGVSSLDVFKRSLCRYTDRSGTTINYLSALLRVRTLTERFTGTNTEGLWNKEITDVLANIHDSELSMHDRWAKEEEVLLGLVLEHFDEITRRMRQMTDEYKAIDAMNDELRKCPTITCDSNIGDIMTEVISLYKQVINARQDIDTFKKMTELCDKIHNEKTSLVNMIHSCIESTTKVLGDIESKHGKYETHLHKVFSDILKGKYIYWDSDDVHCVKYMHIDGVTLKKYGDDMELSLHGSILGLDWGGSPSFAPDTDIFLSYLTNIDKSVEKLHIVDFNELCKLVEKHTPFMLDYIKKLAENKKEKK